MTVKQSDLLANVATQTQAGTPNSPANEHGKLRSANGNVALLTTDIDAGDVIVLCALPTGAVLLDVKLGNDDLDTNGTPTLTGDLGLYSDAVGLVVKSTDVYATLFGQLQSAGQFTGSNLAFEARGVEKNGQKVYQDAGDAADPNSVYYLAITINVGAATAAAGDLAFQVTYAVE